MFGNYKVVENLQKKLASSIEEVFQLMNSGDTAKAAMVKVASGLLPDQVDRLCQVYNRSVSIENRVLGDDLNTKLSSAAVLDPADIIAQVEKRAAASLRRDPAVVKTASLLERAYSVVERPKVAKAPASLPIEEPVQETDKFAGLHHGLRGVELIEYVDDLKKKIASMSRAGADALRFADASVALASRSIVKLASMANGSLDRIDQVKYYCHNEEPKLAALFDVLLELVTPQLPAHKRASIPDLPGAVVNRWERGVKEEEGAVGYIKRAHAAVEQIYNQIPAWGSKIAVLREELHLIESKRQGNAVVNRDICFGFESRKAADCEHIQKVASFVGGYLTSKLQRGEPPSPQRMSTSDKFLIRLNNPQHQANLGAVRSRRALQEMLVDDPVISNQSPEDVIAAHNELSAYSPQSVQNPAVLRAVLRQYLQNNASSFDLSQIRQLERSADSGGA